MAASRSIAPLCLSTCTAPLTSIVDNVFNAGIVLGSPQIDWQRVDLAAARGELAINGESAGEGRGSDVMGHPLGLHTTFIQKLSLTYYTHN